MLKRLFIIVLFFLSACQKPYYSSQKDNQEAQKLETHPEMSNIYLFRNADKSNVAGFIIADLDDHMMGKVPRDSYFKWTVPEGKHVITVYYGSVKQQLELNTEKNTNYYIRTAMNHLIPSKIKLIQEAEQEAAPVIRDGRLLSVTKNFMFFKLGDS